MADLAGFDVIVEGHIETIVDLINLVPVTNPIDGSSIYLLAGPFSTDLNVDLGTLGVVTVRVILDATLHAVVHQPLAQFVISLKGSMPVAGQSIRHIGGQITVSVALGFALPPGGTPGGPQFPVFLLEGGVPDVVLDGTTRSLADAALGPGGADRLTSGLRTALSN